MGIDFDQNRTMESVLIEMSYDHVIFCRFYEHFEEIVTEFVLFSGQHYLHLLINY